MDAEPATKDRCWREGANANDNNRRVYRHGHRRGQLQNNPYQAESPEWKAWQAGYEYRDMVNDG